MPVVETMAGKSTLVADHPLYVRADRRDRLPAGQRARRPGRCRARRRARACRTSRRARGRSSRTRICASSVSTPRASTPPSTAACRSSRDALEGLERARLRARGLVGPTTPGARTCATQAGAYHAHVRAAVGAAPGAAEPSYAQVIAAVNAAGRPDDYAVSAAGRDPRRAERRLAGARGRNVRLRVRLLVHGLRARGRLGRAHGADARATCSHSSATART